MSIQRLYGDWNQTFLADGSLWDLARRETFEAHGVAPPTLEAYFTRLAECNGDYSKVYRSFGVKATKEELNAVYERVYQAGLARVRLTRGALATLFRLRVVSSIETSIITLQEERLFLPVFRRFPLFRRLIRHVRCDVTDKAAAIRELAALEKVPVERCAYLGDAPSDIRAARQAGAMAIAFESGFLPRELLAAEKPDAIVARLRELPKLFKAA